MIEKESIPRINTRKQIRFTVETFHFKLGQVVKPYLKQKTKTYHANNKSGIAICGRNAGTQYLEGQHWEYAE